MRRKDKEVTERSNIDAIINQALVCHLACSLNDQPYLIPLSFGYDGRSIYFHSSLSGKKISILRTNPQVCVSFEINVEIIKDPDMACDWNIHYSSVIAEGKAEQLTHPKDKAQALNIIMQHYSGKDWEFPESKLKVTSIWKIDLESVSAKKSPED